MLYNQNAYLLQLQRNSSRTADRKIFFRTPNTKRGIFLNFFKSFQCHVTANRLKNQRLRVNNEEYFGRKISDQCSGGSGLRLMGLGGGGDTATSDTGVNERWKGDRSESPSPLNPPLQC